MGNRVFLHFMENNNFFIYAGPKVQQELFGVYTKNHISNLSKYGVDGLDEAICFIAENTQKGSFFKEYLNDLTKAILQKEQKYQIYLLLFNAYIEQIGKRNLEC